MKTRTVVIKCEHGLHLRVAARVMDVVRNHDSSAHLVCDGCRRADACSILQLVALGAAKGESLDVVVEGPDEETVAAQLADVFEAGAGI